RFADHAVMVDEGGCGAVARGAHGDQVSEPGQHPTTDIHQRMRVAAHTPDTGRPLDLEPLTVLVIRDKLEIVVAGRVGSFGLVGDLVDAVAVLDGLRDVGQHLSARATPGYLEGETDQWFAVRPDGRDTVDQQVARHVLRRSRRRPGGDIPLQFVVVDEGLTDGRPDVVVPGRVINAGLV